MRLVGWLLRLVLSRDRAAAVIGDLEEELACRRDGGNPARFPRTWLILQTVGALIVALASAAPRTLRQLSYLTRDAARGLRSAPATSLAAVLILALGIGSATVTFSVVDHVVLRHLPFDQDDRLVVIEGRTTITPRQKTVSTADYYVWLRHTDAFDSLAMWLSGGGIVTVRRGDATEPVVTLRSTASLFKVLRVSPLIGRVFGPDHAIAGHDDVAVISHGFWQRHFGGAADVIGRTIQTTTGAIEVLGVMPRGFVFPIDADPPIEMWRPYVPKPAEDVIAGVERFIDMRVVGRLGDGISFDRARTEVERASARQAEALPQAYQNWSVQFMSLHESLVGRVRDWMLLLLIAIAAVMAIACANVANLMLARSVQRGRDFAVRAALGAGRRHLAGVLLLEGLLLSTAAVAAGLVAARWGLAIAKAALPADLARASDVALDARVLAVAIAAAAITSIAFSVVPAWQASRVDLLDMLKDGGAHTIRPTRRRWRSVFLVSEMAFVVLLLVATTLVVASFAKITLADLGFERANLASVRPFPYPSIPAADRAARNGEFFDRTVDALRRLPGVTRVALMAGGDVPLGANALSLRFDVTRRDGTASSTDAELRTVTHEYFETMGIRLIAGRLFDDRDREGTVPGLVIDQLAARRLFGEGDAIGQSVRLPGVSSDPVRPVIGVVTNVRHARLEQATLAQFYASLMQKPFRAGNHYVVLRTNLPIERVTPAIDATMAALMPPGSRRPAVVSLESRFRALTAERRFSAGLMAVLGALALVIGAVGVYSVMASVVSQQTRSLGIRVALGASRRQILSAVLADAGRHLTIGAAIGVLGGWAASSLFTAQLFGVTRTDPLVYGGVLVVLFLVGLGAAAIPARRASRADPIVALRAPD